MSCLSKALETKRPLCLEDIPLVREADVSVCAWVKCWLVSVYGVLCCLGHVVVVCCAAWGARL